MTRLFGCITDTSVGRKNTVWEVQILYRGMNTVQYRDGYPSVKGREIEIKCGK